MTESSQEQILQLFKSASLLSDRQGASRTVERLLTMAATILMFSGLSKEEVVKHLTTELCELRHLLLDGGDLH